MSFDSQDRNLTGNSGCEVKVIRPIHGPNYVRKISASVEYNPRLEAQFNLQSNFSSTTVKTPSIVNSGINEFGLIYFEMQYIPGLNLHEAICAADFEQIKNWSIAIGSLLEEFSAQKMKVSSYPFNKKINDLEKTLLGKIDIHVDQALELLASANWEVIENTACHGDLSLENILIHKNDIYLIDFQDIYYSSWHQDLAKLNFDVASNWSGLRRKNYKSKLMHEIKIKYFMDTLLDKIALNLGSGKQFQISQLNLSLLHTLRIIPYCKDPKLVKHLSNTLISIMRKYQEIKK